MSSVPSPNQVLLSAAGSGKTTMLVRQSLARPQRRIAILTYTLENLEEIRRAFERQAGAVPAHVSLYSWYSFLLRECIRPYQAALCAQPRVESILFVEGRTNNRAPRSQVARHYLAGARIYSDRAADFAVRCDELTQGRVIERLAAMYDELYIDEVQDLAGYDLDLVERLLSSGIEITLVGDTRQATYATNHSPRHQQYRGVAMMGLFQAWQARNLCQIQHRVISHRCAQSLCDLADALYPQMPRTESGNSELTGHEGIYVVAPTLVQKYVLQFAPTVLRYDRREACDGYPSVNFGQAKGRTYSRVLIYPNGPLAQFLRTADASRITSPAKYYVAFTRARQSVAFVLAGACAWPGHQVYESRDSSGAAPTLPARPVGCTRRWCSAWPLACWRSLALSGALLWRARAPPCPADPRLAATCTRLRRISVWVVGRSSAQHDLGNGVCLRLDWLRVRRAAMPPSALPLFDRPTGRLRRCRPGIVECQV